MSRHRNRKHLAESLKPHTNEAPSTTDRTDKSVIRRVARSGGARTVPTGLPLVGSDVLEAVGSKGTVGRAMHGVLYTPDDENVVTRLGPEQEASVSFRPDRALGDAGAEFAEEFGRDFLMAATTGEDISEIGSAAEMDPSEVGGPFLQEVTLGDDLEDVTEYAEFLDDDAPTAVKR